MALLEMKQTCLMVIDVQGKLAGLMQHQEKTYRNIQIMIQGAKAMDLPVVYTEQVPEKLGSTLPVIADLLKNEMPLTKSSFSCCGSAEIDGFLESLNRKQVLITGIESHICVFQTTADLLARGYDVHLISDAVSSRTDENKQIALDRMRHLGAEISSTEMALFELLKTAESSAFRPISRLIK